MIPIYNVSDALALHDYVRGMPKDMPFATYYFWYFPEKTWLNR
jgi:hypothetical protein